MKLTAILTALSLTAALACGKKKDDAPPAPAPTPKPTEPAAVTPPAPPPAPAAPTYSPEAAKAAVGELTKCTSEFNCAAFDTLIGFGAKAAPELVALAVDAAATSDARQLAAAALTKLKAPDVGAALIEAANAVKDDSMLQGDLFEAAGASGGQAVFDTLIAEFVKAAAPPPTTIARSRCATAWARSRQSRWRGSRPTWPRPRTTRPTTPTSSPTAPPPPTCRRSSNCSASPRT
jgi:hypothetical protein